MPFLSRTLTAANGVQTAFPVSFPYQAKADVQVYVYVAGAGAAIGSPKMVGVDFDWTSAGVITFRAGKVPAAGTVVDVRRSTKISALDNSLKAGGSLQSSQLAQNDTQLLYLSQERLDENTALLDAITDVGSKGDPGGNTMSIGLATAIAGLVLATGAVAGTNSFRTDGYATTGDGGAAWYYRKAAPEADQPGDQLSADGVRLGLLKAQPISLEMFGGKINDAAAGAANDAAFEAIANFDKTVPDVYYGNAAPVYLWHGDYYFASAAGHDLKITRTFIGMGGGSAVAGGHLGTRCIGPNNWQFIRAESYNTVGETVEGTPTTSSAGSWFQNIHFLAHGNVEAGLNTVTQGYAIHARTPILVENCIFQYFWDGILNNASSGGGGSIEGQASHCAYRVCSFVQNRNFGLNNADDADNNITDIHHCNFIANGRGGAYLGDFLGGELSGACHFRDNGCRTDYFSVCSQTSYGGNWYYVNETATMATSDAALRTGNPSTNPLWTKVGAGAPITQYPDFNTFVGTFQKGGPIVADRSLNARYVAMGYYSESAQPPSFWNATSFIAPALSGSGDVGFGLGIIDGKLVCNNVSLLAQAVISAITTPVLETHFKTQGGGAGPTFRQSAGYEADGITKMALAEWFTWPSTGLPGTAETVATYRSRVAGGGGAMADRFDLDSANSAIRPTTNNTWSIGLSAFRWLKGWFKSVEVTDGVLVNGNQVLSAQGASLPANASDLATAITLVNAIKARMKVTGGHGLVAD